MKTLLIGLTLLGGITSVMAQGIKYDLITIGMTQEEFSRWEISDTYEPQLWGNEDALKINYPAKCDSIKAEYDAGNKFIMDVTRSMKRLFPRLFEGKPNEFWVETNQNFAIYNVYCIPEADGYVYLRDMTKDEWPMFAGGQQALQEYFSENMKYPAKCMDNGIQGVVMCSFIVEADGSIYDIRIMKGVDPLIDNEAKRLIENMPLWTPGIRNGRPSAFLFNMPVRFKLQ